MIEFKADGPFSEKADPLFPDRVRIIGLGQTGACAADQLVLHGRPGQDIWVFDTDQQTVEASVVPNRHLLGQATVHGLGCSGDLDLAREIVAAEAARLAETVHGCDFLILIVGFSGASGMALAEHLAQLGRHAGAKVVALGVQPLAFEGVARRERSNAAIATLRAETDSVLVLSLDRMHADPGAPRNIRHSFHLMHQHLAQAAQALAQVVCKRGLIQLSFADVRSLYGRYQGTEALENCWIAHVEGDIHDTTGELIDRLFNGPLVADEAIWKLVDHAIVAVGGTRDLGLSDVQEMVGAFKERLETDIAIATSASLDEEQHDRVRMTVLLAMTAPVLLPPEEKPAAKPAPKARPRVLGDTAPLPALNPAALADKKTHAAPIKNTAAKSPAKKAGLARLEPQPVIAQLPESDEAETLVAPPTGDNAFQEPPVPVLPDAELEAPARLERRIEAKQEEMQFEGPTRGRFEKTHETIYRGENLDQPTFRRRRLVVRL